MKNKKKFRLVDAILGTVCLTLVCESVMPTAAIGNTQYFWWILLLIGFCLPYGMITGELGTTYPSEGGMYDWVKRAFGPKWVKECSGLLDVVVLRQREDVRQSVHVQVDVQHVLQRPDKARGDGILKHGHGLRVVPEVLDDVEFQRLAEGFAAVIVGHVLRQDPQRLL